MEDLNRYLPDGFMLRNGTYKIERVLGSGGFGNTYLVRHEELDAEMVIKEFFMKGINMRDKGNTVTVSVPDNRATFESQRAKFKKEAQRLWKLKSDHIVGVHDIFEENGTVYYVMDFIDGESLDDRLKLTKAPLPENDVIDILAQLMDALATIHHNQPKPIFHLDIKPNNILMGRDGKVVLIDFGASKQLSGTREGVTSTLITYTKGYAPSEQVDGKLEHIGAWTDLYAVGATIYRLLTTNQPPEPSDIIIEGEEAFLFPKDVSKRIRGLIVWMMQPNRKKRPQTVEEVREWLEKPENPEKPESPFPSDDTTIFDQSQPEEPIKPAEKPWKDIFPWKNGLMVLYSVMLLFGLFFVLKNIDEKNKIRDMHAEEQAYVELDSLMRFADYTDTDTLTAYLNGFIARYPNSLYTDNLRARLLEFQERYKTFTINGVSFTMVKVEAGTFTMGATSEQGSHAYDDEKPIHKVTLTKDYYIGKTEVTQALWQAVMGSNPSNFKGDNLPVETVSWDDSQTFITKLNSLTGSKFRLPSEAEWEYAARGGKKSRGYKYSGSNSIDDVAWYYENSGCKTHDVGIKSPNELGLYDMSGNVEEWCNDWGGSYSSGAKTNPIGPSMGSERVARGGFKTGEAGYCRVSFRSYVPPDGRGDSLGLRLAL